MRITAAAIIIMAVAISILSDDAAAVEQRIHSGEPPAVIAADASLRRIESFSGGVAVVAATESHADDFTVPDGMVLVAVGPASAVLVPAEFARQAIEIVQCESRWLPEAVGDQGRAFGLLQIRRDYHAAAMARHGLVFGDERDRWTWAVRMWTADGGFRQWSCKP